MACCFLVALTASARMGVDYQMALGNPSQAKTDAGNHQHYLIQRSVFAMDYDDLNGEPNWVSWDLTAEDKGPAKRTPGFHADAELPAGFQHITSADYKQSGFDRGHMCPSADRTDNPADNEAVFTMANIVPQTADNNQGVWEHLEADCRTLAKEGNELLILCGPDGFSSEHLANHGPAVPGHTWKIVVVVPNGPGSFLSRNTAATRIIAVNIPNIAGVRHDPWKKYEVSVNQLEGLTGLKFFTAVAPAVARGLKAQIDGQPTPFLDASQYEPVKALPPPGYNPPPVKRPSREMNWVPIALTILIFLLVLVIVVLVVFFRTRPKR
jgi:DNA/RNA endonuclease G (NUC1)